MIAPRGYNIIELDRHASSQEMPYAIITADCSNPQEIDDGIYVEPLQAAEETYRVGVCVADASRYYDDGAIRKQALTRTEAKYWNMPNGKRGYDPMINAVAINRAELTQGNVRDALMVSFVVGEKEPPGQVEIAFGKVEVRENQNYKRFGQKCRYSPDSRKYGRASAFIVSHLQFNSGGDGDLDDSLEGNSTEDVYNRLIHVPPRKSWLRGSRLNEAFMVTANYLVGQTMAAENRPAIYRVHTPEDESLLEFMPANIARYSRTPGFHDGLGLGPYCRVTSPLRRLEDFMMCYQLKQRSLGLEPIARDYRDVALAVQRLNQRVVADAAKAPLRLGVQEVLGSHWEYEAARNKALGKAMLRASSAELISA